MNPGEHVLSEGWYKSDVAEPASGDLLTGLAWLETARSATDRRQTFLMLYL